MYFLISFFKNIILINKLIIITNIIFKIRSNKMKSHTIKMLPIENFQNILDFNNNQLLRLVDKLTGYILLNIILTSVIRLFFFSFFKIEMLYSPKCGEKSI